MKSLFLSLVIVNLLHCTDTNRSAADLHSVADGRNQSGWATRFYPITGIEIALPRTLCLEIDYSAELAVGFRGMTPATTVDDTLCLVEIRIQRRRGRDEPIEDASPLRAWADAQHLETSRFKEGRTVYLRRDVQRVASEELRVLATIHGPGSPNIATDDDESAAARAVNSIVCKPRHQA